MILEENSAEESYSLTYTIQNIVVKSSLKSSLNPTLELDLKKLSEKLINVEYNSDRFPGLFLRLNNPKCVIIIFRNGKLILTGIKSFVDIDLVINKLIIELKNTLQIHIDKELIKTVVVNIVITADFFKKINLDLAAIKLENSIYEPEVFPGLVYNCTIPVKSVFLIFSTGKIVFTGIREKNLIEPSLIYLGKLIKGKNLFL
ncbi:MAG: TATA-box-binding protein [Candidatus Hodarchaeota archaeon]